MKIKITGNDENGATIVFVALTLTMLLMFAALAIDVGHLYGVRNELQNAADAGALAGASVLFENDGSINRERAISEAKSIAESNKSGNTSVSISTDDIQIGHWSFTSKSFTPSAATTQIQWQEQSFAKLDLNPDFINAVRVLPRRSDTPSFFANILGYTSFLVEVDAVAYIGFAGTLFPTEVDQPIAICKQSIVDINGTYSCKNGRMIRAHSDTAGFTDFSQGGCSEASKPEVLPLVCADGNPNPLVFGETMGTSNGQMEPSYNSFYNCWLNTSDVKPKPPNKPWKITLPVIACVDGRPQPCSELVGAVTVNVLWVTDQNDSQFKYVPKEMNLPGKEIFQCEISSTDPQQATAEGKACWEKFVTWAGLIDVTYDQKTIYFVPDCSLHKPVGETGGENYGILAKYPKLVE